MRGGLHLAADQSAHSAILERACWGCGSPLYLMVLLDPQRREAEEVLIDLLDDVTRILDQIKSELHGNVLSPALLAVAGEWFDRTARIAKVLTDGDLATKLHARVGVQAQDLAATVWGHLAAIVEASLLTAGQRWELWQARFAGLELIRDGRAPYRLSNDEVHRFTTALQVAAAREAAIREGLPWDA